MRTLIGLVSVAAACSAPVVAATPEVPAEPASAEPASAQPASIEDPCGAGGTWSALPPLDLPGRVDHTAVWTGREMVLWGGTQDARFPMSDGARYQPATGTWHRTSARQVPLERDDHAAVWTGREMIVWGGNHYDEQQEKLDSGGRYDPELDAWRPTSPSGLTARDDPRAVWTGREMIVWGGRDERGHTGDGARYSPGRDRWRPVARREAPEPREDHAAIWTGTEMIIWGGWNGDDEDRNYALHGGRYDPATDTWRPISTDGAPEPREDHTAIWTGREMIVWGGVIRAGTPPARHQVATGGRYDPATDTWSPLPVDTAPTAREDGVVVWTGTEMLVWGGQQDDTPLESGARYLPSHDRWCSLATDGAPPARRDHAGVWTGSALVLWGGQDPDGDYPASGAAYVP